MFFSQEFFHSKALQWCLGVSAFAYFLVFSSWVGKQMVTAQAVANLTYRCPPYFQSCESFYFLNALPYGYSQTIWYMLIFGALVFIVYLLAKQRWVEASIVLLLPYLWHAANTFIITEYARDNYEYYVFIFTSILLFFPHKEYFIKLSLVMFYVLSTFAKVHPAWIAGSYFTNLQLGLPLFPNWSIPLMTNLVMLAEMVGAWFLLSKHPALQRTALVFFIAFHLYSGILVEYRYPATVLPMVLAVFGPWYRYTPPPLTKRALLGWGLMALLLFMQLVPKLIPGDEKLTLEGNEFGLYMFESNHQCVSEATYYFNNGETQLFTDTSNLARNRCDPYRYWFFYQQVCTRYGDIERISWTFDHSINGNDFLRIVDVPDVCTLTYTPFGRNEWIKTHADAPAAVGKPVKNIYY